MSTNTVLASRVADLVGGPGNVSTVQTCATRLRFVVKDKSRVQLADLKKTPGVMQVVESAGQIQVVIGTHVEQVRDALVDLPGWGKLKDGPASAGGAQRPIDRVFDFLSGTFQPLLYPLIGAAMVKVVIILLVQFGWLDAMGPTGLLFAAAGNSLLYFLPIFVGFTASRKLGANPFLGATITAALLEPNFVALGAPGEVTDVLGVPLYLFSYASSMLPALLAALALAGTERFLKRVLPPVLHLLLIPTIALLVLVPLSALVFGPIGVLAGQAVASGLGWLGATAPVLLYVVIGASWVFLVSIGLHWALFPMVMLEFTENGASVLFGAAMGYQAAMIGVALGVFLKARRDKTLRTTAGAALTAVAIGGITEPTLYGMVLRYKRVLLATVLGGAAAGLVLGLFQVKATAIVMSPVLGLPALTPTVGAVLGLVAGIVVPTVIIMTRGYQSPAEAAAAAASAADEAAGDARVVAAAPSRTLSARVVIASPVAGKVVPLSEVPDPIFSANLLGHGLAVLPSEGRVVAPADGTVVVAPQSGHAVGIRTDDGVEVLVHVGIDTVKMAGEGFALAVAPGDRVRQGQVMLTFDTDAISRAGYSLFTPVIITNGGALGEVSPLASGDVTEGGPLLAVEPRVPATA